ncbi:M13 family metallopeptidase [Corynebacterium caspium]|uniref:M13 family metallopeptidase n=1 Tax=Corynebacterium caspium TaxID=234828 RepID=UPI0003799696|nr:M13-type metalloendopeptidase [Corynebacterium caspium]WKD58505.1 Neutral endopeptidase [Corynebacterium caspium DSM 44850]
MKDLYEYVNGQWLSEHKIPADRGVDGTFHALRDQAEAQVHELVEKDSGRAGTLYRSFMDTEGIKTAGLSVLDADFQEVNAAATPLELAQALGALDRVGVGSPAAFWVEKDSRGTNAVAYIVQSGLGLPDEAYYHASEHAETLAAYEKHVAKMLGYLGVEPAQAAIEAGSIVQLEKDIAAGHWDVVSSRDALKTYNPTTVAELPELIQQLLQLPDGPVIVMMPSYLEHLTELLSAARLADWKLWAKWHILRSRAGVLDPEIGEANFAFYGQVLSGATEQRERWKRGIALAESLVGQEIGKAYVAAHFPAASRDYMLELVDYLVAAYRQRISTLPWMTATTRERALAKLELFNAKIGYPDTWRSFAGLEFSAAGADLVANVRKGSAFQHDYELGKLGKPADREEWFATPQTVNAFYNPVVNDITFPAAILQPPFFDPQASSAQNFGAIGAVIGHEIGHGFDDQGSQYDGHGNLEPWWTDEDRAAFTALTDKLVAQFDGLVPSVLKKAGIESNGVNGKFTLGENIGDLGGLGISVVAYKNWAADHGEELNFQELFIAWATVWRTAIRPEMATQYLAIDPHSPAEFRCNVIAANIAEFYQAFPSVDESADMYIAPEDRVQIW